MQQQIKADDQSLVIGKSNFGVLEVRMDHAESELREIKEEYRSISGQLRELRALVLEKKPQYGAIASMLLVIVAITGAMWGMAIDPIRSDINAIKNKIEQIVPRETHVMKWAEADKKFDQIDSAIASLRKEKLDRLDVESLKAQLAAKIDELNARLKRH